ncbi:MAG TPA: VacJ family lipoprotein [Myxococcota bacterium]|nr:VacJ family lipoprotein [Myxococcota bacterium]
MAGTGPIPAALALGCLVALAVLGSLGCAAKSQPSQSEGSNPPDSGAAPGPEATVGGLAIVDPAAANPPPVADAGSAAAESPESAEPGTDPLFEDPGYELPPAPTDPLEPMNRVFFTFNQRLDRWFWEPLTQAYRFVTPEAARTGVRNALRNLNSPVFFVNNLLQLRFCDAGQTFGSFLLNSTLGMGGLFEPGLEAGWKPQEADFGQTLALTGIPSGAYVVVPILGPTTLRDGLGSAVDRFFQPLTYVLGLGTQLLWGGGAGLSTREEVSDQLRELERSSVDFYAAMRSVYLQNRDGEVEAARERRAENLRFFTRDRAERDAPLVP